MSIQDVSVIFVVLLVSTIARFISATTLRQSVLLVASYFMYAKLAGLPFLALLIASSLINYFWGRVLERRARSVWLWTAISSNLLLLVFFKYLPSLAKTWPGPFTGLEFIQQIILPLGISFWTFQALSFLFDVYLEEDLTPSLLEFCLYMAFWPTVALGPVCRLKRMLPQFRRFTGSVREDFLTGTVRIIQGLFMKFVLAQLLMTGVTSGGGVAGGFDAGIQRNALDVWILAIGYGFQLFFDFAGYSHIVIGAARLAGIRLDENFNWPYLATTPAVFWTRWHMSLSFWIRDYLYFPLSTLRRSTWWHYTALVVTMVIFGFWHAAKATLILWGLYNGLLLVGHRVSQQLSRRTSFRLPELLVTVLSWAVTFLLICLGYVFFRANDLGQALQMFVAVLTPASYSLARSTLAPEDFMLISMIVLGYFAYAGLTELMSVWNAYYLRQLYYRLALSQEKPRGASSGLGWTASSIAQAVAVRKWWVLVPVLALLLTIIGVTFLGNSNMAPFVYQHF
jgi:alginate O-acetyltransferase complex protein AlgI